MIIRRSRSVLVAATLLAAPLMISLVVIRPAHAWRIVYDPTNYSQNVLTAARTLQQINQQITQLQNEAQMLINQARNLASLPYTSLKQLQQSVQKTQQLLSQAQNIAFDVQKIDQAFQTQYGNASMSASDQALVAGARERWQNRYRDDPRGGGARRAVYPACSAVQYRFAARQAATMPASG